jgi:hypothetical protein
MCSAYPKIGIRNKPEQSLEKVLAAPVFIPSRIVLDIEAEGIEFAMQKKAVLHFSAYLQTCPKA